MAVTLQPWPPMDCPRCGHALIPLMDACLNCRWNVAERKVGVKQAPMTTLLAVVERGLAIAAAVLLTASLGLLLWTVWVMAVSKP